MGDALELPDVWAPVGTDDLPQRLVASFSTGEWGSLRHELSTLMDGAITDGVYGRQLLQLVLALPTGVDPVFDRYRVAAMLDHGDWDGLRDALNRSSIEARRVRGLRDILTATVEADGLPAWTDVHELHQFEIYEYQARRATSAIRHWAQRVAGQFPSTMWTREDVAIGRHLRYRQLQDTTLLAVAECHGGVLEAGFALASEAKRLGDRGEPIAAVAEDLVELSQLAMGDRREFGLAVPERIRQRTGPSPIGSWEMLMYVMPLLPLRDSDSLSWAAELAGYIASRIASPRWQLQSDAWRVAGQLLSGPTSRRTELAGLVARARRATPGLKALPAYLQGFAHKTYEPFAEAERLARRSGNVWLQISALAWMTALDPKPGVVRRLRQLLEITGWRRLVLVPTEIAADAALGMTSFGERSEAILEMALAADRPNVTTELVAKYIDDAATPKRVRLSAVNALGRVGTTHAREILSRLAHRRDEVGAAAAKTVEGPSYGLSEREIEVLSLAADGLTNKQIGEKLFLSQHTIARHLANARAKLGAANRAEAAALLHKVSGQR